MVDILFYVFVGIILWVVMLKLGVYVILVGVVFVGFIFMWDEKDEFYFLVMWLEYGLNGLVSFVILFLFVFVNVGISFGNISLEGIFYFVIFGIFFGLVVGK